MLWLQDREQLHRKKSNIYSFKIFMTDKQLQDQIINDLKRDFPEITIKREENTLIIKGDDDTLWEIFDILYRGMDNVEFNMDKEEGNHIIIKT